QLVMGADSFRDITPVYDNAVDGRVVQPIAGGHIHPLILAAGITHPNLNSTYSRTGLLGELLERSSSRRQIVPMQVSESGSSQRRIALANRTDGMGALVDDAAGSIDDGDTFKGIFDQGSEATLTADQRIVGLFFLWVSGAYVEMLPRERA